MKLSVKTKLMLIPLTISLVGGVSACSTTTIYENGGNVIWSISSAEKVFLDKPFNDYDNIRDEKKVDITAFRGEHEGKQLIITPTNNVTWYNATATDLVDANGNTIPTSNIKIYVEKYLKMTQIYDTLSKLTPGRVPDGLVPIQNSLDFEDNTIEAGTNQGLYIDVEIPVDAVAGSYTGTISLTIDGLTYKVPMNVEVLDVTVNEETHSRSVFLDHWQFWNGELDMSQEMIEKYHKELGEYRLSPNYAVIENELSFTDEGMNYYVEKTYEQLQNPKITTICIPYQTASRDSQVSFNEDIMKKYIKLFWNKSIETKFNMIEKLAVYFGGIIDEPDDLGILDRANLVCDRYKICINEAAEECSKLNTSDPLHDELVESIKKIRNIVTSKWTKATDGHIETYCPKASYYDTAEDRAHYDSQEEKWWYTCVLPRMPYPTYHLEDSLSSGRLLSWMASNYDVVGNLFWSCNCYATITDDGYQPIGNYFTGKAARYWSCNGDGFLFYPGKQYGYDGPLPSLRLQAIRDGNEEYEVLYNLKEKAKSLGLDDKAVFNYLTNCLYTGTKVRGDAAYMEQARLALANLTMASNNGSDFTISKCEVNDDTLNMEFYAKAGTTLKVNGTELAAGSSYKDGNIYSFSKVLNEASNDISIEVTYGGKTKVISNHYSGAYTTYGPNELKDCFTSYGATPTVTTKTINKLGEIVSVDVSASSGKRQTIKFNSPYAEAINQDLRKVIFYVNNPMTQKFKMSIGYRGKDSKYDSYFVENYELAIGLNTIELDAINLKLTSTFEADYFFFAFGDTSSKNEDAKTVQFKSIVTVNN